MKRFVFLLMMFISSWSIASQTSMTVDMESGGMIKNQDGVITLIELPKMDVSRKNGEKGYTKTRFTYINKLGDRMNCLNLVEGDFLKADLTNKGWDATVQNKDGTKGNFIFQGNASFIKTTTNGYAFCVNNS